LIYESALRPSSKIYERVAMAEASGLETDCNLAEKYENILNKILETQILTVIIVIIIIIIQ